MLSQFICSCTKIDLINVESLVTKSVGEREMMERRSERERKGERERE